MFKFKKFITEKAAGGGQSVAVAGTASERHITKAINYYAAQKEKGVDHDTALARATSYRSRTQPSKIKDPEHPIKKTISKLGRPEYDKIWHDSKHAAHALINHVQQHHGEIVGAIHTGADIMGGVQKATGGKKSSADVLLKVKKPSGEIHHVNIMGASLKYSTTTDPGSNIKVHSPTPNTLNNIIEKHHEALHGKKYGLADKIAETVSRNKSDEAHVYNNHAAFLHDTFTNKEVKNTKGRAIFTPHNEKGPILNDAALSHVRRLTEAGHPQATAFYSDLRAQNVKMKTQIADHYHKAISNVLTGHGKVDNPNHKKISNSLFRSLVNVPERRSSTHVDTLLMNTTRSTDKKTGKVSKPKVTMYHAGKSVRNYLDSVGPKGDHKIHKNADSSVFRVGPATVGVDVRPGSKSGAVNVTYDKKAFRKVGEYQ